MFTGVYWKHVYLGVAMAIAAANYPEQRAVLAALLLYMVAGSNIQIPLLALAQASGAVGGTQAIEPPGRLKAIRPGPGWRAAGIYSGHELGRPPLDTPLRAGYVSTWRNSSVICSTRSVLP